MTKDQFAARLQALVWEYEQSQPRGAAMPVDDFDGLLADGSIVLQWNQDNITPADCDMFAKFLDAMDGGVTVNADGHAVFVNMQAIDLPRIVKIARAAIAFERNMLAGRNLQLKGVCDKIRAHPIIEQIFAKFV